MPCEKALTSKLSGNKTLGGFFDTWVKKNSVIGEEWSRTFSYDGVFNARHSDLSTFSRDIYAYDGEGDTYWALDESGNLLPNFRRVCTIKADLSSLERFLKAKKRSDGQDFWRVPLKISVFFGGTALKARLSWYEGVSISRIHSSFHPHVTDIWLCLSGNPARRSFQHHTGRSLLDHVCFLSGWEARSEGLPFCISPIDTIDSVKLLTLGGVRHVLCW